MRKIRTKDIEDFNACAKKLDAILQRIRAYNPAANIFAAGNTLNLMSDYDDDSRPSKERETITVSSVTIAGLDSGDW